MKKNVLFRGLKNPEGPVSLPDGSWLVTEMDIAAITHINSGANNRSVIIKTGLPNGLAVDKFGNIWVADSLWRALVLVTMEGDIRSVTNGGDDIPFLLPNDLCFGPDGLIYMTDSGILLEKMRQLNDPMDAYDTNFDGKVFQINPIDGSVKVLDRGLQLTNGIAFGPNGTFLYVAETLTGNIYRYKFGDWKRSLFGNVMIKPPRDFGKIAGPDGIAFDKNGNLFAAVLIQGDITVLSPDGTIHSRIPLQGNLPTNVAFDCISDNKLIVTEASLGELISIDTPHNGLLLYT